MLSSLQKTIGCPDLCLSDKIVMLFHLQTMLMRKSWKRSSKVMLSMWSFSFSHWEELSAAFPGSLIPLQTTPQISSPFTFFFFSPWTLSQSCDAFSVNRNHSDQSHPNHPLANLGSLLSIILSIWFLFWAPQGLENAFAPDQV